MTLYVQRHAPTPQNKETDGPEKIRGWGGVGLGPEGQAIAKDAAQALKSKPPSVIFTSDLPRAKETADIMGRELGGIPVVPAQELRTWNVGDITGQEVEKAKPKLDELQHTKPMKVAPNGESYQDFYGRWGKAVQQLQQASKNDDVLVVVHGRQVYALPNQLTGKGTEGIPTNGAPNPGDILAVKGTKLNYVHRAGSAPKVTT